MLFLVSIVLVDVIGDDDDGDGVGIDRVAFFSSADVGSFVTLFSVSELELGVEYCQ